MDRAVHRVFALGLVLAVTACKGGGGEATACTADTQCAAGARCLSGLCEYPYRLTMAKPTGRAVTNGAVELQVSATGGPVEGPGWQPASVELWAADRSLATVGPPEYATTWRPLSSEDGTYAVRARVTVDGQVYESLPVTVVVDHQAPGAPAVGAVATPRNDPVVTLAGTAEAGATVAVDHQAPGAPAVETVTTPRNDPTVTLTGTAEAGATVAVADGPVKLTTVTAAAGGAWTAQVRLAEGRHGLLVTATDEAGNGSTPAGLEVVVDLTPPEAPQIDAPASPTALHELAVTGTAEPGSQVQVAEGAAVLGTAVAGATGSFSYPAVLANGEHALHALATDEAGNVSGPSRTVTVKVDSAKPSAPTLVLATPTNADPVPVSGTADAGTVVRVYEGTAELASAVADAASRWSAALPGLGAGSHALRAQATSATGVESDPTSATVMVDRTAPAVASRTPVDGASNVWSRDAIVVTFTKPIVVDPHGPSPVSLATQDGTAVPADWALSTDGLTLTGRIRVLPPVPNTLTAQLSPGLSDAAGNRVVDAGWSWAIPDWHALGVVCPGASNNGCVVSGAGFGSDGAPWVALQHVSRGIPYVMLRRWDGARWADVLPPSAAMTTAIALDVDPDGTVVVGWIEYPDPQLGGVMRAAVWTATGWSARAELNVNAAASASGPAVWASPGGRAVASWTEAGARHYAGWDGAAWQALAGLPAAATRVWNTSSGGLVAVWTDATGLSWCTGAVAGFSVSTGGVGTCSPEGVPFIARAGTLEVSRRMTMVGGFVPIGRALNLDASQPATPTSIVFRDGAPFVGWAENGLVAMKGWDGGAWQLAGSPAPVGTLSDVDRFVLSPAGHVGALQLLPGAAGGREVVMSRYNR